MLHRGVLAGVYGITLLFGLGTTLFPSESVQGSIGSYFTFIYGILLLAGAIGCLIAISRPNYKFELIFLWPMLGGYALYAIALWNLFAERLGVVDGAAPPYGPALAVTALTLFLLAKVLLLVRKNRELVKAFDHGLG